MDKIQNNLTAPLSNPLDVTTEEKIRNQAYEKVIRSISDAVVRNLSMVNGVEFVGALVVSLALTMAW